MDIKAASAKAGLRAPACPRRRRVARWCTTATFMGAVLACVLAPAAARALEVEKLTCQPNGDSGSEVLGGTETRITWEVQADADEAVAGLSLTVPEGTTYTTEDLRVTMLSGEDLMDREFIEPEIEAEGETLTLDFPRRRRRAVSSASSCTAWCSRLPVARCSARAPTCSRMARRAMWMVFPPSRSKV